jgi:hypothetical protein
MIAADASIKPAFLVPFERDQEFMGREDAEGQQRSRRENYERSSVGALDGQVHNTFENRGNVANQAGQQIVHGDINIDQSV